MAAERLSMRQIKEVLRQKWVLGRTHREVAASLGVSTGGVSGAITRATAAGLDWNQVQSLDEVTLATRLYGAPAETERTDRPMPDPAYIHAERSRPGVTLELLHLEYLEKHPNGYRYTQYCEIYRRWAKRRRLSMRQVHHAGEKLFVDFSGKKPSIVDPKTGEVIEVELFVAVLGASNYTYAEATRTQQVGDWIGAHVRAFAFLGGVPRDVVPDQLKSGVTQACRYDPKIQRTYEELARHYGTTVLPARPASPKDKAKVEVGVQVAQRWILARLRNRTFFSLEELNSAIAEMNDELNERTMRTYGASRRELFERLDCPALRPLPAERFVVGEWRLAKPNIDYHVEYDGHYYSVEHSKRDETFDLRVTATTVEIFLRGVRIDAYARSHERGRHTTRPEHMPKSHREHAEWSPSRLIGWAKTIGAGTEALVEAIIAERQHPEQGYRSCLGILRLSKKYGPERLEAACARAVAVGARSYRHVDAILRNGLDRIALPTDTPTVNGATHKNVRGRDYYH
jgi:transposase